ncbi:MAG: VWA domain-containing protein [Proteobacteria bacterium]|nr:VWA domain-containing protein [Pseudomonadota bacterium]MBU4606864.1 VWA domain-containing protein [Pseudomonadota bacterium]MCG2766457.1 VWA domain-containing protein [Desulfarculaceae bacterium]
MPRKAFALFALLLTALILCAPTSQAAAPNYPEVVFILDASGSMWGQAGGKAKIAIAKEVMAQAVPGLPAEVRLGLVAYGHRKKGDCSDVEVLVAPGSSDRAGLLNKVQALSPKGKTPIAGSLKQTAEMLKSKENETTIVLVSDGMETCDADPCGVVKALKAGGIKFVLHVVGFDVDAKGKEQLTCLAQAGEGKYFSAGDAAGLLAALEAVKKEVTVKVEAAKTTTTKAKSRLGKLKMSLPADSLKSLAGFRIIRLKDNKVLKEAKKVEGEHPLLAGKYKVVLLFAQPNYRKPDEAVLGEYEIKGGEVTEVVLGAVAINIAKELTQAVEGVSLIDQKSGQPFITHVSRDNDYYMYKTRPVPPGTYALRLHYSLSPEPTVVAKDLKVSAGQTATATVDSGIALKKAPGVTAWNLHPNGQDKPILQVRRRFDNDFPLWKAFAVPPGSYDLYVLQKGMTEPLPVGEGIKVEKGKTVVFDAGI